MNKTSLSGSVSSPPPMVLQDEEESAEARPSLFSKPPIVSITLLAVNIALFIAMWVLTQGNTSQVASSFGSKVNGLISSGQTWRFLTPVFLHGGLLHLIVNSISLLWLGTQMESIYGSRKFFLIYLVAGVAGNLASYWRSPEPSLGASGAIFGLIGAGMIFPVRFRALIEENTRSRILSQLLTVALTNLAIGFTTPHVDNWAHMGGLIGGAFMALFLLPEVLDDRPKQGLREAALWLSCLAGAGVLFWAARSQWRVGVPEWRIVKEAILASKPPPMIQYRPNGPFSWWRVDIPASWRREKDYWRSPQGALLRVTDSLESPKLVFAAAELMQKTQSAVLMPSQQKTPIVRTFLQNGKMIVDISMASAGKQGVLVWLESEPEAYKQAQRDMNFILASLKILREPTERDRPAPAANSEP